VPHRFQDQEAAAASWVKIRIATRQRFHRNDKAACDWTLLALARPSAAQKRIIYPPEFRPDMPFSPGVLVGDTLYCAGQTGQDLKTNEYPESFEDEST
jgi:enamine deaminase RidA (YjgF/YER057c/UK114 family)